MASIFDVQQLFYGACPKITIVVILIAARKKNYLIKIK